MNYHIYFFLTFHFDVFLSTNPSTSENVKYWTHKKVYQKYKPFGDQEYIWNILDFKRYCMLPLARKWSAGLLSVAIEKKQFQTGENYKNLGKSC